MHRETHVNRGLLAALGHGIIVFFAIVAALGLDMLVHPMYWLRILWPAGLLMAFAVLVLILGHRGRRH